LRRLLQERNNNNTPTFIIQNTTPTPVVQQISAPVPRRIKKTVRSPQSEPVEEPAPIEVPKPIPIKKPEPAVVVPIEKPKPPVVEPKVIPKPIPKPVVINDGPKIIKIYFSPNLNPGLTQHNLKDGIELSILE
jgi:hypothetical protein